MSGFGGAVKLTGESEYRKALQQITQNLKEVTAEMKAVSSSFDKNDKSAKALTAQSDVLTKKLSEQTNKLNTLKAQYDAMSKQYSDNAKKHSELVSTYEKEKAKLDELDKTMGKSSDEYQEQKQKVSDLAGEVRKSTQAQDANEKSMSKMRVEISNAQADCNKTARELDNLGKEAEDSGKKAEKGGEGFTVFKAVLANLATDAIKGAINGLKKLGGAFIDVGKQAIASYATYEQLEGGVKKIFGDEMAQEVIDNANKAFSTAGMSANEYMDTVTGFSATLLQGLGDDTAEAAKYADIAIRNMSDNANTFGTDMSSIQYAYQGFAKGNFTMLDNLKLGYGGTQAEMARLINESGVLGDAMEVTAETVKDVPFHKMIEAIDKTQERMGIMGTTAKEAAGTIEGSTGSMSAAWQNMLTGMADENANFETLATNFLNTLITEDGNGGVIGTMLPRITQVIQGISSAISTMLPKLIEKVVPLIQENLPLILSAVQDALQTILGVLPQVLPVIADLIPQVVSTLISLAPEIINAGIQLLLALISGLNQALPQLVSMLPSIIQTTVTILTDNLPLIIQAGIQLLLALISGLNQALPQLIDMLPEIVNQITISLLDNIDILIDGAFQLFMGLVVGLGKAIVQLAGKLPEVIETVISGLKEPLNQIFVEIWNGLVEIWQKFAPWIDKNVIQPVVNFFSELWAKVKNAASDAWTSIKNTWAKVKGWFNENVISPVKNFFSDAWNSLKKGASDAWSGIKQTFATIPEWFRDKFRSAWQKVKDVFSSGGKIFTGIKDGIVSAFKAVVNAIIGGINKVVSIPFNSINNVLQKLRDISILGTSPFGWINTFSVPQIPLLARGGILRKGEIGLLEGSGAEAVVPLENNSKWIRRVAGELQDSMNQIGVAQPRTAEREYTSMVRAFKEALAQMKIELDDEVAGKFVERTVTRVIYS